MGGTTQGQGRRNVNTVCFIYYEDTPAPLSCLIAHCTRRSDQGGIRVLKGLYNEAGHSWGMSILLLYFAGFGFFGGLYGYCFIPR